MTAPETLIVGSWSSHCGNCGKAANPQSETHDVVLGYGPENGTPGCGVRWTQVESEYGQDLSQFRPDLVQVGLRAGAVAVHAQPGAELEGQHAGRTPEPPK